jgi:UDP-glucose 6-dehydrogenase
VTRLHRILIVGYGEVGKPLFETVRGIYPDVEWLDVQDKNVRVTPDIMHITYPEQRPEDFVLSSVRYIERFSPRLVLIETTVTPGTTFEIDKKLGHKALLCHSPVRGNIAEGMKKGLLQYTKFIGPVSAEAGLMAKQYYESLGLKTYICHSPIETELGKLFETTYRGIMMSWFQEIYRICEHFDAQNEEVIEFIGSTEKEGKQPRPVFHPGVIGGHCIIPNAEKLYAAFPSKFVGALLESNRKREQELSQGSR